MGKYFGKQPIYSEAEAQAQAKQAIDAAVSRGRPSEEEFRALGSRMGDINQALAARPPMEIPSPPPPRRATAPGAPPRAVNQILRPRPPAPEPEPPAPAPARRVPRPAAAAAPAPAKRVARAAAPAPAPVKRATRPPASGPAAAPVKRTTRAVITGPDAAPAKRTTRDRKSTRLNSSHIQKSRMPSSA